MRSTLLAASLLLAAPLAGQSGTTVWSMRMKMPDTLSARAGGLSEIDMRMTMATDGERLGMQVDFAETMASAVPGFDLSAIRFNTVVHGGGDSVSIGIILPPEMAAMTGGGIGMRLDMAIPDKLEGFPVPNFDSLMAENQGEEPVVTNTGRTMMVAGVRCEEWDITPQQPADSIPFGGAMHLCVAENIPAVKAFTTVAEKYLPDMGFDFGKLKERGRKWFGGREMTAIRMVMGHDEEIVFQLESSSNTAPDPSFFTLPDGLEPFPIEMVKAMIPGSQGT
jgi:hypothetical protein